MGLRHKLSACLSLVAAHSLWVTGLAAESLPTPPYVVVTSDTHISAPDGRYPNQTAKVERFFAALDSLARPPDAVFITGDVIDNAVERDGHTVPGDAAHFQAEADLYSRLKQRHPRIAVMQALGPGHDFGGPIALRDAETAIGPKQGVWRWGNVDFIWLTIPRAAFPESAEEHEDVLAEADYRWLDERLQEAGRAVLLFHVPLRTAASYELGRWPGARSLTIDPRDRLYQAIKQHSAKIAAIFNGHIHHQLQTHWKGIPIYIAPFMAGDFATLNLHQPDGALEIRLHRVESADFLGPK
jgi:UDP-2,3-diacylglucosamine pyrophosphatase LpxH